MKATKILSIPVFSGLLFGYHIGIIGPALPLIAKRLALEFWPRGHLVSIFIIGLILGAYFTKKLTFVFGRKKALNSVTIALFLSAILGFFVTSYEGLLIYRLLNGIFSGLIATLGPMLAVENVSIDQRAKATSFFQICIALGVAFSYLAGLVFLKSQHVDFMFLSGAIFAASGLYFFSQIKNLKEPVQHTEYLFKKFKNSYLIGIGLNVFQQTSGINSITFFIQTLLSEKLGDTKSLAYLLPLITSSVSILATFLMIKQIDKWGRKPFLLLGAFGMALAMGTMAFNHFGFYIEFTLVLLFVLSFGLSFGPITYLVTNEVFPDHVRPAGASIAFLANCLTNYAISLFFLPLKNHFGSAFMWSFFAAMSIIALLFVWKKVPETNHKKVTDIVKKLNAR